MNSIVLNIPFYRHEQYKLDRTKGKRKANVFCPVLLHHTVLIIVNRHLSFFLKSESIKANVKFPFNIKVTRIQSIQNKVTGYRRIKTRMCASISILDSAHRPLHWVIISMGHPRWEQQHPGRNNLKYSLKPLEGFRDYFLNMQEERFKKRNFKKILLCGNVDIISYPPPPPPSSHWKCIDVFHEKFHWGLYIFKYSKTLLQFRVL